VEPPVQPAKKPGEISPEMRAKLLGESQGLGGFPDAPMPTNLVLNICIGIASLAILCKVTGLLG
jgi:hypothetical protein